MQFLGIARGSVLEVKTQLEVAKMLGFGKVNELEEAQVAAQEITKILNAALTNLKKKARSA